MKIELTPLELRALRTAATFLLAHPQQWSAWTKRELTPELLANLEAAENEGWSEQQGLPVKEPKKPEPIALPAEDRR